MQICDLNLRLGLNSIGLCFRLGNSDNLVGLEYPTDCFRDFLDQNRSRLSKVTELCDWVFVTHDEETELLSILTGIVRETSPQIPL